MNRAAIIQSIDDHAAAHGLKRTTIGQMAVRNHRLYANLKGGSDIQVGTVERLLEWLTADAARRSAGAGVTKAPASGSEEKQGAAT